MKVRFITIRHVDDDYEEDMYLHRHNEESWNANLDCLPRVGDEVDADSGLYIVTRIRWIKHESSNSDATMTSFRNTRPHIFLIPAAEYYSDV